MSLFKSSKVFPATAATTATTAAAAQTSPHSQYIYLTVGSNKRSRPKAIDIDSQVADAMMTDDPVALKKVLAKYERLDSVSYQTYLPDVIFVAISYGASRIVHALINKTVCDFAFLDQKLYGVTPLRYLDSDVNEFLNNPELNKHWSRNLSEKPTPQEFQAKLETIRAYLTSVATSNLPQPPTAAFSVVSSASPTVNETKQSPVMENKQPPVAEIKQVPARSPLCCVML